MKISAWLFGIVLIVTFLWCSVIGTSANKEFVESGAVKKWNSLGYEVIGCEGFKFGSWLGGSLGGAEVWYQLKMIPDNGIRYSGYLQDWGGELQEYGPFANSGSTLNIHQ